MSMIRTIALIAALAFLLIGGGAPGPLPVGTVQAQEDWRAEFDDLCSKTADSMQLSNEEVKTLIERCDKLKPRIEKLDESTKKVYLKRLAGCRNLFSFILDSRANK